jgi:hypothetical protein
MNTATEPDPPAHNDPDLPDRPRRPRRRPMTYRVSTLHDGTILAACPERKPARRIMKRDHCRIDADGVLSDISRNGKELRDWHYEGRFRFQDIIANRLNARRAIRELVLPELAALRAALTALRSDLARLEELRDQVAGPPNRGDALTHS